MTSAHRLIAIVIIWISVIVVAWLLFNAAFLNSMADGIAAALMAVLFVAAAASTWAVARRQ